jgi:pyruvate,orthophosphate dikinase
MILAGTSEERLEALAEILPLQRADFAGIFRAMGDRPVTVRTLDPPLHEFLPHDAEGIRRLAGELGVPEEQVADKVKNLAEANPMLGFRGCRLTWAFPEILETQVRAIFEAVAAVRAEGIEAMPEIMIPLVGHVDELRPHKELVDRVAAEVAAEAGTELPYHTGTMIEIPRAALTAGRIAEVAEFFSFGTNDLTQTTLGISRDDSGMFLPAYVDAGIYEKDPFATLDLEGPGRLMQWAVDEGRRTRPGLKVGICGEHGGDPATVGYCHRLALDYVSCSPFRLPVARLAAAQASLRERAGARSAD